MESYEPGKACPERDLQRGGCVLSSPMWERGGRNGQVAPGSFLCQVLAGKDDCDFGHTNEEVMDEGDKVVLCL